MIKRRLTEAEIDAIIRQRRLDAAIAPQPAEACTEIGADGVITAAGIRRLFGAPVRSWHPAEWVVAGLAVAAALYWVWG